MRAFVIATLLAAGSVLADTPLQPPKDWSFETKDGISVRGDLSEDRVEVRAGEAEPWIIEGFRRTAIPDDEGAFLLVPYADNLIASNDPDFVVYEVFAAPGDKIGEVRLGDLLDPFYLVPAASHYVWASNSHSWDGKSWTFSTPDGGTWRIRPDPFTLILY
ncbi:hypothetical protein AAD018_004405 [Aestuariibius insulae]|uniref:hypothetical protein n=1 Tax=Aestuariibius insulae TaxID=2058287 RepID=UPI00345E2760